MTKGRHRKSIAAKKAPIATSTPNPDVVQLPLTSALDITIRMFASRYRSCIKGIRTDLHNLNLWHASSKVVLDVLQLPKRPRRNKWIRIYSWIALICMRYGPYALSSHSKETNSHKWIDQTVLQTRHHSSLRESPKAKLERQSNSDNQTDKSEPGL